MRIGALFSGVGLLELGLERAGLGRVVWQCEIDAWCRAILARHWPAAERHQDVRSFKPSTVDIVCGGFPCQPVSIAGRQRGQADPRWLWPEFARIIAHATPRIVIIENVPGLLRRGLRIVLADLAALGFDAEWTHFRASALGAPHERDRLWLVAAHPDRLNVRLEPGYLGWSIAQQTAQVARRVTARTFAAHANGVKRRRALWQRLGKTGDTVAHTDGQRRLESAWRFAVIRGWARDVGWDFSASPRMDDGVSRRLDLGRRRKALGNGCVVQCATAVGLAVRQAIQEAP